MRTRVLAAVITLAITMLLCASTPHTQLTHTQEEPQWGFYGHRLINKLAVFALPQDVLGFYKRNIDYISEHAIDPDKRRYASKHEAVRHYIDIDAWDEFPFFKVPRSLTGALIQYSKYTLVNGTDSLTLIPHRIDDTLHYMDVDSAILYTFPLDSARQFFNKEIMPQYYEDTWQVPSTTIDTSALAGLRGSLFMEDHFSQDGILPYHLLSMKHFLTAAFRDQDQDKILRLSAEYGHYIGDAHVPLHTTTNYNGQLTDQVGIHAFWESRIPELFAEAEYNFVVGRAKYIEDPNAFFWDVILDSHKLLDDVLLIEKELSETYPNDQQYCYDDRLGRTIRTQCPEYAKAYQEAMNGMVEARMQDAILAISSIWYTCWVDGGQPDLKPAKLDIEAEPIVIDKTVKTRGHE